MIALNYLGEILMVSTFINPVVNPEKRLGTQPFDENAPVRLWQTHSEDEYEIAIRAVYKQVLGNAHVMESERLVTAESQLKNGELSVRGFVRQVAKSELYRTRFFEPCSRNRFIELNFKHLLGRAPEGYADISEHSNLLETSGFDAEIDTYLDSDEYQHAFGEDTVPYYRGHKTQPGQKLVSFTHLFKLLRGASSSDKDEHSQARLNYPLMANTASNILPVSGLSSGWQPITDTTTLLASVFNFKQGPPVTTSTMAPSASAETDTLDTIAQKQYQVAYQPFKDADPVERVPNASSEDIDIVIRAVYRQVLGNAYVMESERLGVPESQLKSGDISVREFVRQVAKSELYRSRFFENCYWYRAIELNHKHLLGRAPQSFEEMKAHSAVLDAAGYEADIDSYLDSDEYQDIFGENIVPYYRGYNTQPGQNMLAFTNMIQLLKSASSSDKDLTGDNKPRLTKAIIGKTPYGKQKVQDVQTLIAEALRPTALSYLSYEKSVAPVPMESQALQKQFDEQATVILSLQNQLSDLRPLSSIGASITRQNEWSLSSNGGSTIPSAMATKAQTNGSASLQQKIDDQVATIEKLKQEIADARPLATIAEARLNKWRQKSFR
ncbi:MAG: phycobilisome rod-core linker polypeptide [Cyanobacteria bacterium P01_G01_bin.38]